MPYYSADIGCWDHGRVVRFEAKDDEDAITFACNIKKTEREHVVQIRELENEGDTIGRVFFDFMNGHMK